MARSRDVGLFLLVALLFGTSFPAIKAGLTYFPPLVFAASRYAIAGVVILAYAVSSVDDWRPRTRRDWAAVAAGGPLFIGGTGLLFVGQQFTTSGVASIIYSGIPILTALVGWWLLPEERLTRRGLLGVLVGFAGVTIVIQPDPANLLGRTVVGNALVFSATVTVTLGTVLVRRSRPTMSIVALTGWSMLCGAALQLAVGVAIGESFAAVRLTPTAVLALAYLALFAGALVFVLYFLLLERFGALQVNLVAYLQPIVAVVTGWLLLGEAITLTAVAGFAIVFLGFLLVRYGAIADAISTRWPHPT